MEGVESYEIGELNRHRKQFINQLEDTENSRLKNTTSLVGIIVISTIILISAITGLIMNASGVPMISTLSDSSSDEYESYEAQDWDECCKSSYDGMKNLETTHSIKFVSPLTSYFIFILIFSLLCLTATLAPIPSFAKAPLVVLMSLATTMAGIFLMRKYILSVGFYVAMLSNLAPSDSPTFHLHVMVYFSGFLATLCLSLGFITFKVLKRTLTTNQSKRILSSAISFLNISLLVFLISPLLPLTYIAADKNYPSYDEGQDSDGIYHFGSTFLISGESSPDTFYTPENEREVLDATYGNYNLVDNLFLAMIWINMSMIMLVALSRIPKAGFLFESIAQINILSLILIILALVFTIIMYVNIPNLLSQDGPFSEDRYTSLSFHMNWILLLACILAIANWIVFLVKSHIPWWVSMGHNLQTLDSQLTRV
tara:strand:- start:431 stop:1711 length:1281 start_codon:yes stop_codon:yes gene_type:complete